MKSDFTHLHVHSEYSLLDGMPRVEEYAIRCAELGYEALALTEHGNLRSMYLLQLKAKGKFDFNGIDYDLPPIKPIFGIEFYMTPNVYTMRGLEDSVKLELKRSAKDVVHHKEILKEAEIKAGIRTRFHVLCFAKNQVGLQNLLKLNYLSWRDGFYYRPRIDMDLLETHYEGIVLTTSCTGGWAPEAIIAGDFDEAAIWMEQAQNMFGDDLYVELQPHKFDDQAVANKGMIQMADEFKLKTIATNDCHYLLREDHESHDVMLAIQTKSDMKDKDRWSFSDEPEFYLKSREEMFQSFKTNHSYLSDELINTSLENTTEIVEKCNAELDVDWRKGILPPVNIPVEFANEDKYLTDLCIKGWSWRGVPNYIRRYAKKKDISVKEANDIYKARLNMELKRIFKMKFSKYFLIIWDILNWCREQDIMVGPGRGSSAGSIVCWLTGITSIDPIFYNLLFDRFLNENRVDFPDVDMDFQDDRRDEVFKYIFDKYGEENCCKITTYGRMKGKMCLLDVGRVFNISPAETYAVNKHIIERTSGDERSSQTVEDSFNEFEVCKKYNEKYPFVLGHVNKLEGKARQAGVHAAGIQIADRPMHEIIPVEFRKGKSGKYDVKVSAFDWLECQAMGLVKIDILGLKNLSILKDAANMIKQFKNLEIDFDAIDVTDKTVLANFTAGRFVGIFQFDSIGMIKTCEPLTFKSLEDIIALCALYRPAAMRSGLSNDYVERASGGKTPKMHPIYDDITKETYGALVYQEQMIRCFVELAGYDPGTGDELRKKIAKKVGQEVMGKEKEVFIAGSMKSGVSKKDAESIFTVITFAGSYAFNKSHSSVYSLITFWCMWLKTYHPTQFFYALMKHEESSEHITRFVVEARKMGVKVLMPDINSSKGQFSIVEDGKIICGLVDIKQVGDKATDEIVKCQPFTGFSDFCERVDRRKVNKGVVKSLVMAGAFKEFHPNLGALLVEIPNKKDVMTPTWERMLDKTPEQVAEIYGNMDIPEYELDEEQVVTKQSIVCPIPPPKHKIQYYDIIKRYIKDVTPMDKVEFEGGSYTVMGILVDIKYNNIGDFDKSDPDGETKKRIRWGARYANVNIEDETGLHRCKIDVDEFPAFRGIIDRGSGTPVMVKARTFGKSTQLFGDIMIDLDEMREALREPIGIVERYSFMSPFEQYFLVHPTVKLREGIKSIDAGTVKNRKGVFKIIALVCRIKRHWTKKDELMYFMDVEDNTGVCNMIVWPSEVKEYESVLKQGSVCRINVRSDAKGQYLNEAELIKVIWDLSGKNND